MPPESTSQSSSMMWLIFALLVVLFWGCYGVAMHAASESMGGKADPHSRYKAYILVGVAYLVIAVFAPMVLMVTQGASWSFPGKGVMYALLAGTLGAFGAFFVLSAMGSVGKRPWMIPVVMCVVFAGAPIVNAIVALIIHPPKGGWGSIHPLFYVGILVAACGAAMATYFKPGPVKPKAEPTAQVAQVETGDTPSAESKTAIPGEATQSP